MLSLQIKGQAEIERALQAMIEAVPAEAAEALNHEAEVIKTESQKIVPLDTGTLMNSAFVDQARDEGGQLIGVRIGYGGAASDYAIAVHEHLSEHSPQSWRIAEGAEIGGVAMPHPARRGVQWRQRKGGGAIRGPKYLEKPFLEIGAKLPERIGERIRRRLARARG